MLYNTAMGCLMSYTKSMDNMQQPLAIPYKLLLHLIYNLCAALNVLLLIVNINSPVLQATTDKLMINRSNKHE